MDRCGPLALRASQTSKQRARVREIAKFAVLLCLPCRQPIPAKQPWHFRARSVMEHALPEKSWLSCCALHWQPRLSTWCPMCSTAAKTARKLDASVGKLTARLRKGSKGDPHFLSPRRWEPQNSRPFCRYEMCLYSCKGTNWQHKAASTGRSHWSWVLEKFCVTCKAQILMLPARWRWTKLRAILLWLHQAP